MAYLHRLAAISGDSAGFLLPIFRARDRANVELVQDIDRHDNVSGFRPIVVASKEVLSAPTIYEIDVGKAAVWAFRDQNLNIHIGYADEIRSIGERLLIDGAIGTAPMAAAELAAFCGAEIRHSKYLVSAHAFLSKSSPVGADIWRDSVVLLPAIKADISNQVRTPPGRQLELDGVFAVSESATTHIFLPSTFASRLVRLPRWTELAKVFGIKEFVLHTTEGRRSSYSEAMPDWTIVGIGGIADYVLTKPPFTGAAVSSALPRGFALARGSRLVAVPNFVGSPLVLGIVRSNLRDAKLLNDVVGELSSDVASRHAINIRPIGHGPPRSDKPGPDVLSSALSRFEHVWIIANHRLRYTGNYWNSLSVSNGAARFVRSIASALIATLDSPEAHAIFASARKRREGLGLFGAVRHRAALSLEEAVKQVLYSMLSEDALLWSAREIFVLWPYKLTAESASCSVRLGGRSYDVRLIERPQGKRKAMDVVGFATGVALSKRTEGEFRDFCRALFEGYGWVVRNNEGENLLLEDEGEVIRIWPVASQGAMARAIRRANEFGNSEIVVTNQTITKALRQQAEDGAWTLIHYSSVGLWMKREYRKALFNED